jgi:hypothetical protein
MIHSFALVIDGVDLTSPDSSDADGQPTGYGQVSKARRTAKNDTENDALTHSQRRPGLCWRQQEPLVLRGTCDRSRGREQPTVWRSSHRRA